ncbi:hypothetical protein BDF14DRAFT_1438101 [Spinellus fusiger]|nr:hypothetical protein BDF14DRAFT_1438101 [Spinellus fusiger]
MDDDNERQFNGTKKFNSTCSVMYDPLPISPLPSITYASPDYRPPPREDALWLQSTIQSPIEDLTDNYISTSCQEDYIMT